MSRATLLLALLLLATLATPATPVEVRIYHARMGPVYHKLPDGTVIEVYADIYYPDTLYVRPPAVLGTVNVTIHTNWTGLWDGIITVMVVDPGYRIDPTLYKPTNAMWAWGEGGATIGSGSLLAPSGAIANKTVTRTVTIYAHDRVFNSKPGTYKAQYFFRIRLAFFDARTGQKPPGGDINIYTNSSVAPYVEILVGKWASSGNSSNGTQSTTLLIGIALAGSIAAAAYIAYDVVSRRRASTS